MQDRQYIGPWLPSAVNAPRVIPLWLFSTNAPLRPITQQEELWASKLARQRQREYRHSRGCLRYALSDLFNVKPLEIPLIAKPGCPPQLNEGLGYVSMSHCRDALLIGWSESRIGVDIERLDRSFSAQNIATRYFSLEEQNQIFNLPIQLQTIAILEKWLIKESAIKWHYGSIAADLVHWHTNQDLDLIVNTELDVSLNSIVIRHGKWSSALVSDLKDLQSRTILCIEY